MNHQPTLAHVPGILLRTVARCASRVVFLAATAVLLLGLALVAIAAFLATFRSFRGPRTQLAVDLVVAAYGLVLSFKKVTTSDSQ